MEPESVSLTRESTTCIAAAAHFEVVEECLRDLILDIRGEIGVLDDYDLTGLWIRHEISKGDQLLRPTQSQALQTDFVYVSRSRRRTLPLTSRFASARSPWAVTTSDRSRSHASR